MTQVDVTQLIDAIDRLTMTIQAATEAKIRIETGSNSEKAYILRNTQDVFSRINLSRRTYCPGKTQFGPDIDGDAEGLHD